MEMWGQGMLREAPETGLFVKVYKCIPGDSEPFPFMSLFFSEFLVLQTFQQPFAFQQLFNLASKSSLRWTRYHTKLGWSEKENITLSFLVCFFFFFCNEENVSLFLWRKKIMVLKLWIRARNRSQPKLWKPKLLHQVLEMFPISFLYVCAACVVLCSVMRTFTAGVLW